MVPKVLRKHYAALIAIVVYNFAVFFPVAFMQRVVSPNDVFYNFQPWASLRTEPSTPQNALLNDPPTAYYTIFSMVKRDWRLFHWNPYLACGVPGFGSSASAVLSPFVLLPILVVPLEWTYTLMIFLKINTAFVFAYLWLREERLGRRGAALGAIVIAGAGVYAVRLLWQITSVTVLFPALLWITRRAFRGKPVSIPVTTLIALAYALSGFPAAMAYGAYVVILYALVLMIRHRRIPWQPLAAVVIALMIAAPSLIPFAQFIRRSGYLEARQTTSMAGVFPLDHWRNLIEPDRLGNPAYKNWRGDPRLGVLNNYVETSIYFGALVLLLAILGLFNRRARMRWFWAALGVVLLFCMFGANLIGPLVARLPGFKYSALARVALLLPLPIGYLVAASLRNRRMFTWLTIPFAAYIAFDLGMFAGRFHPYLRVEEAHVPSTPMIDFLREDYAKNGPFRVVPFFDYLWPNSAELFGIEDLRSHFSSEGAYRRLMQRLDPGVWSGQSTVLQFNSLNYHFNDPLSGQLGVRYYIEHPQMDIIKWKTFEGTRPAMAETGILRYGPGALLQRTIRVNADDYAIEIPARVEAGSGLDVSLISDGRVVWSRQFSKADANVMDKLYIPVVAYRNREVTVRVQSRDARGWVPQGGDGLYYANVKVPVVFERQLPDGRVFRNLSEMPRFWGGTYRTKGTYGTNKVTVVTDGGAGVLFSSEKITPELRVTVDGEVVKPEPFNEIFASVQVPAGKHEIVFERRLARGYWWLAVLGVVLWLISFWRPRSPDRRTATATRA